MFHHARFALLTVEEMARADQMTIRAGISGADLMEAAGLAVVRHIMCHYDQVKTLVLCGPGNNGGDGFVIARHLKKAGWDVELVLLGAKENLAGEAAVMAKLWRTNLWNAKISPLTSDVMTDHGLVVDALFGAGLCRPIEGPAAELIDKINRANVKRVAVDIPSGVEGNSGQIRNVGLKANSTVTFFRKKPGHLLFPGREFCGNIEVADIGILTRSLQDINPQTYLNDPAIWCDNFPVPKRAAHKYDRGHGVVISGGPAHGGAARLAARAALRIGAGLVSITCPDDAVLSHASHLTAVMIKPFDSAGDIEKLLADKRLNAWCVGPGCGVTDQTKSHVLKILAAGRHAVIDADGLSVFEDQPDVIFKASHKASHKASKRSSKKSRITPIFTPHDGEFSRLFPDLSCHNEGYNKLSSARKAAVRAGAVIILKGPDTVIAAPDGRAVITGNAPPTLATAGSGDVLAGICMGLMAQGMDSFPAACAAVWIHGAAAQAFGPGLISEDIEGKIPEILQHLLG